MASSALRVLAMAYKEIDHLPSKEEMATIENDLIYFDIVNKAFVSAAENGGKPPAFICQCIHNQYLRLKEKYFTEKEIVDNMQNYFAPIALIQPNSPEARIIVSYFIQLCEVFDAPAR